MKKALKRIQSSKELYFYKNGERKIVDPNDSSTYPSELWGNISELRGNVNGLQGNIDECEITDEERKKGVRIEDLVE